MAFPTLGTPTNTETAFGTSHSIGLPTGLTNGRLLMLHLGFSDTETVPSLGTGWVEIYSYSNTGWRGTFARIVDGTESSTLSYTSSVSGRMNSCAYEVTGWYGSAIASNVVAQGTTYTGASGYPRSNPANTPSWGAADTLWVCTTQNDSTNTLTTAPTSYTSLYESNGAASNSSHQYIYYRANNTTSETPGSWTLGSNRAGANSTVAIRPSAVTLVKKLKVFVQSSAASTSGVAGIVFASSAGIAGAEIGEFTGKTFEASLESGKAVLKVPVDDFGGSSLTTSDTPVVLVRTTTNTTGIISATIIEE
jgi:hypothetical protein